jgi:hypothetical protein
MSDKLITVNNLAQFFQLKQKGEDKIIKGYSLPNHLKENTIVWCKTKEIFL